MKNLIPAALLLLLAACGGKNPPAPGPAPIAAVADLAAALHCAGAFTSQASPVLLVHGTGANSSIAWDSGLAIVLREHGYDVCTVDLPNSAWEDIAISTQYVVYGVEQMAQRSGKHVSLIGHSQGVVENLMAIKQSPKVSELVDESIGLAGAYHGLKLGEALCRRRGCPPAGWQMDVDSRFIAAANLGNETPGHADYTSIYSTTDEAVPPPVPVLKGATNIAVQDVCAGREVSHSRILVDAVSVALVLDALSHPGPVGIARIARKVCEQDIAEGIPLRAKYREALGKFVFLATIRDAGWLNAEPLH